MEIKTISTEIIKPSSPTPQHLRTHKLFLPNHVIPDLYVPMTFFYSAERENATRISSILKKSLSKLLTYYYPFAGKNIDGVSTDCNDHGVPFIETQAANGMSEILQKKDNALLKQLVPFNGNLPEIPTTCYPNLFVQVTYFSCGGIAISILFSHRIADGSTAAYFFKSWGEVARAVDNIENVIVDYSSIYPPSAAMASVTSLYQQNHYVRSEIVTKMFVFDRKKIAALRERISNGPYLDRPSRFEATSVLILGTLMKNAATEATQMAVVIPINLRNKTNPPLPPQCMGNLLTTIIAKLPLEKKNDYNFLAGKLHESIRKVVGQYKTNVHEDVVIQGLSKSKIFHISDLCKMPYYEADFGWGKPTWFVMPALSDNVALFIESRNGEGIEVWMGLPKEDMSKFEKDPEILAYTQLSMSIRARL